MNQGADRLDHVNTQDGRQRRIDGNGALWLRRQASEAVKLSLPSTSSGTTNVLDYIPSHPLRELIFANVGAGLS